MMRDDAGSPPPVTIIQWSGDILDRISTPIAYMDYAFRLIRVNQAFADFHHKPIPFFSDRYYFAVDPNVRREEIFREAVAQWQQAGFPDGLHVQCGYWRLLSLRDHRGACSGLLLTMEPSLPRQEIGIPEPTSAVCNRHTRKFTQFSLREQGVIFQTNVAGRIEVSEGDCFSLPEFSHGLAVGRNIFEMFQSCPEFSHALYRALEGSVVRESLRVRDSDLEVFLSPYYDAAGAVAGIIGVAIDGSERKQYEQRLIHAKEFLARIMDSIPDLIYYKDEKGRYLGCNQAFSIFHGMSKKAILGKDDAELFDVERAERLRRLHRQVMESGKPHKLRDLSIDAQGKAQRLETTEAPVFRGGVLRGTVGISRKRRDKRKTK